MQRRQHGCSVTCWFTLTHSHAVILTSVWPFLGMWHFDGAWETWLFKSSCMWSEQYRRLLKTKVRCLAIAKHYQNNPKKHHHNIATGYQWACWECDNPHSPLWCCTISFPFFLSCRRVRVQLMPGRAKNKRHVCNSMLCMHYSSICVCFIISGKTCCGDVQDSQTLLQSRR